MKQRTVPASLADKLLDRAAACFDMATIESLSRMSLDAKLSARVDRLAAKANEGELTGKEREEYQAYIRTSEVLTLLHLRARQKLRFRTIGLI